MNRLATKRLVEHALLDLIFPAPARVDPLAPVKRPAYSKFRKKKSYRTKAPRVNCDLDTGHAVIIERPTLRTIAVRWSDSQSGYYGEQIWRIGVSRSHARCSLTGQLICPGDTIFRPLAHEWNIPFNQDRMILASAASSNFRALEK
jgi:hypothetical protein